ncbi:uncharacterized protein LOC128722699 [Anopheles nili]|uniref:uncharacterized protein LOC128722699 n=1 Tax=Anopheles nili TaxID=185578 RepID=UPI00237B25EF|nr:uncharacterized protein LOC128722699 [Anopheles nili]
MDGSAQRPAPVAGLPGKDTLPVIGRSVNAKYRRHSDPTKIFETDALKADNNRSSIVKAKHKKEKSFPVAWRSELNKPRSGSAQARLENLRAALQKEIDDQKEQKSKASTSESKLSSDQNSFPVQTLKKEKNGRESELKSKYDEGLSNYPRYFYCIVDTCVFINHYKDIDNFLTKKFADRQPILIVPYKVLDELDIVKYKKPHLETQIMPVIKFLHRMLRAKDPRIKGQHPWDDTVEFMPINSPDDSIINCALQVQSVADSEAKVLVVSNDCNMLTKALVAHLDSCTMAELQKDYKF